MVHGRIARCCQCVLGVSRLADPHALKGRFESLLIVGHTELVALPQVFNDRKRWRFAWGHRIRWSNHEIGELGLTLVKKCSQVLPLVLFLCSLTNDALETRNGLFRVVVRSCSRVSFVDGYDLPNMGAYA